MLFLLASAFVALLLSHAIIWFGSSVFYFLLFFCGFAALLLLCRCCCCCYCWHEKSPVALGSIDPRRDAANVLDWLTLKMRANFLGTVCAGPYQPLPAPATRNQNEKLYIKFVLFKRHRLQTLWETLRFSCFLISKLFTCPNVKYIISYI